MKKYIICLFIALSIMFVACDKIDVSKLSDKDLERIGDKLIVCNKPYIRYSSECCLDKNDNAICDKDEGEKITKETPSGITPPVQETPAQPTKPEIVEKETPPLKDEVFQEKCTLQSGISCLDFKVTSSSSTITIKNSLGYDITIDSIIANQCTGLGNQGLFLNGNSATYTLTCINSGSRYNGQVNITYTNPETGIQHKNIGQIMAKISGEILPDIKPPIKETTTSSEQTQEFQDKCTLPAGLACLDHKATATSLVLRVQNSLGYDIKIDAVKAVGCDPLGSQGTLANGAAVTWPALTCTNSGSKYNGQVNITFTTINADGSDGLQHNSIGQVTTRIE